MTLWPPDWHLVFGIVAFALASLAAQGWRELAVLIALTAALIVPVKWLGGELGFPAYTASAFIYARDGDAISFTGKASAGLETSIILAAILMIAWRHVRLTRRAAAERNGAD